MQKLAILGGEPVKKTPLPDWPYYDDTERQALQEVLESRVWWRTPGTRTLQFEQEFAAFQQASYGVAVTNGTAALEVSLAALGIGAGDEVIVPDFTFVATASAVLFTGALPVLVDVTPDTYCIDPDQVEAAITPATKAIIAVHMGGHPADLDRLTEIARKNGVYLLEDSAHAHGSEWRGRKIGAIGDIGTFSFQASKLMTAGEGGMIVTNSKELERLIRSVHDCGRMPGEWFYSHFIYGSNYRLSEWQGAVLSQQQQLDVANQLMSVGRYEAAAQAYEGMLGTYGSYPQREQVELILGLIYARYLRRQDRARQLLEQALGRLRDEDQKRLARQVLDELEA